MSDPESIDPRSVRSGPIRHESLPPELLQQIEAVFDVLGDFLGMPLEQFELGFMRDTHPESEINLWCGIAKAWLAYHEDFVGDVTLSLVEERQLLSALLAISLGASDAEKLNVPVQVAKRLLQCYDELRKT